MTVGEAWKRALLTSMTAEELDVYLPTYKQKILEQGIVLAKQQTVCATFAGNFDVTVTADLTGLTAAQVNLILADDAAANA